MLIKKMKNIVVCGAIALSSITLFSGCDTSGELIDETTALSSITLFSGYDTSGELIDETTTVTTAKTLSDEELDALAENMPEIVFVMSHHYDDTNILGFYITNTGEMKMYDFRSIAPDEIYEIPDVYERLEEATCSEIYFDEWSTPNVIWNDELPKISSEELIILYQKLLMINENAELTNVISLDWDIGDRIVYGVRKAQNNNKEFIIIGGGGDGYILNNNNQTAFELLEKANYLFPDIPMYDNFN